MSIRPQRAGSFGNYSLTLIGRAQQSD